MIRLTVQELITEAAAVARPFRASGEVSAGDVGAALLTLDGALFTGVCIDTASSLGFCAEHAAVAEMLKTHRSAISIIVAVDNSGRVVPPCGRCRELIWQLDPRNRATQVVLGPDRLVTLDALLPNRGSGNEGMPAG